MFEHAPGYATAWLLALTAIAATTDAWNGSIPNWLTLPSLLAAPLVQLMTAGPGALTRSLAAGAICALVPLIMFGLRAIGGGDVKLFAAIGVLGGVDLGLQIQLGSYALLALCASCMLTYRGQLFATLGRSLTLLLIPFRAKHKRNPPAHELLIGLRLGPAIFASALTAVGVDMAGA